MKKLITLLATATLALSTVAFADDAKSNDVLKTIPGGKTDSTVIADASATADQAAAPAADAAKKPAKKHHKAHGKKIAKAKKNAQPAAQDATAPAAAAPDQQ